MASDNAVISLALRETPEYVELYRQAFGPDVPFNDAAIRTNVEAVLDVYMGKLISLDSDFDKFITGDDDALDESEQRGFALFVGRAMCAECHRGSMFTDEQPHVTGVADTNPKEKGHDGTGAFFTPGLRDVAKTAPYMHNGSIATLADVVEFYRWGGHAGGYLGVKDALMQPVDLDGRDINDLTAFLGSLTGTVVAEQLRKDTHVVRPAKCAATKDTVGLMCSTTCTDINSDKNNCGSCGHVCAASCQYGMCTP